MKKFIFKQTPFLLIPLCVFLTLDLWISGKLKYSSGYPWENEVWNDIYSQSINSEISIYGSSKAWVDFNSQLIEDELNLPCYNLGVDGSSFLWQYLRHAEYIKTNNHPDIIILSVDIYSIAERNAYSIAHFLPYMLWNMDIYKTLKSNNRICNAVDFLIPMIRYFSIDGIKILKKYLHGSKNNPTHNRFNRMFQVQENGKFRNKGYRGMNVEWTQDFDIAREKLDYFRIQIDTCLVNLLEKFIYEANKENINLIFVLAPEYIEGQKFVENRQGVISILESLSQKHDVPYFDYSNSNISYEKRYFYNALHLNKEGSEIFTKQLISDIQKNRKTAQYLNHLKDANLTTSNILGN